jgi:hypothetical protein
VLIQPAGAFLQGARDDLCRNYQEPRYMTTALDVNAQTLEAEQTIQKGTSPRSTR